MPIGQPVPENFFLSGLCYTGHFEVNAYCVAKAIQSEIDQDAGLCPARGTASIII